MERLTERFSNGQAAVYGCGNNCKYDYKYCHNHYEECPTINAIYDKLAEYEDAEEQGLMLPVAIGSDVYYIPSKVNYKLNVLGKHEEHNRVYHQKVNRISFNQRGWYLECDKDLEYGIGHILVDVFYKETWFTSKEEAEQALAKIKGGMICEEQ